jgi:hypothetical protein
MSAPDWLVRPIFRMEAGRAHWDRTSSVAEILDHIAGGNETMAGAVYNSMIRGAPSGTEWIALRLVMDADTLRQSVRTRI